MGKVLLEISVAVDGYVAGPDITPRRRWGATASVCTTGCSPAGHRPSPSASRPTTSGASGR